LGFGQNQCRIEFVKLDPRAAGACQLALSTSECVDLVGQNSELSGRGLKRRVKPHAQPVARKNSDLRIVGRIDHIKPHLQNFAEETQVLPQVTGWQAYFGADRGIICHVGPSLRLREWICKHPVKAFMDKQGFPCGRALV